MGSAVLERTMQLIRDTPGQGVQRVPAHLFPNLSFVAPRIPPAELR